MPRTGSNCESDSDSSYELSIDSQHDPLSTRYSGYNSCPDSTFPCGPSTVLQLVFHMRLVVVPNTVVVHSVIVTTVAKTMKQVVVLHVDYEEDYIVQYWFSLLHN